MKSIPACLSLLVMSLVPLSGQGEEPELAGAEVTIPYAELRALLETVRTTDSAPAIPEPPLDAALLAARYWLDFSGPNPSMKAEFEALTFKDGWHYLPLFGGDPRLDRQESASESASVVWREGSYGLLVKGIGTFSAELSLSLPNG
ncbi:MAG: hypothetical protein KDM64_15610, partial [Verrucomicrobiae bacterium]|nr:hypothetical protein [Verrucomicrobiae bacterium]